MKPFLMFALLLLPFAAQAEEGCNAVCHLALVKDYYAAVDRMWAKGSAVGDVERVMAKFDEEAKYEHPAYGANFDRESFRAASLRNLEAGRYDNVDRETRILNSIHGRDHAAIEYFYGTFDADGAWQPGKVKFALFGFRDGRIALIREYW